MTLHRSRAHTPAARKAGTNKRSAHNVCEGCGHFRSQHRYSKKCTACDCQEMVFDTGVTKSPTRHRWTDEDDAEAKAMLDGGASYRTVARHFGRTLAAVQQRFKGYGITPTERNELYPPPWLAGSGTLRPSRRDLR